MEESPKKTFNLWLIYINIVLYAFCFQLQRPLEPFLVKQLMGNNNEYARLQSFFSLVQTVGSLWSGRLLDLLGVKGGFLISFGASALCYLLLSQSTSLPILYASKVPGIFQAGYLCAQAAISQMTEDGPQRVKALGFLSFSYTVGAVIGPSIGGFLGASGDYYFGAKLAVAGSVLSMILTLLMDSETHNNEKKQDVKESEKVENQKTVTSKYWSIIQAVWLLLSTKVISSVANSMSTSIFPLVLKDNFQLKESGVGLSMSAMSACNALINGFLLEPILKFIGGSLNYAIYLSIIGMTIFNFVQAAVITPSFLSLFHGVENIGLYQYLLTSFVLSIIQYVLATTTTGESTSRVQNNEKGTLLGLEHSLFAAARIATPQLGTMILTNYGVSAVSISCGAVYGSIALLWIAFDSHRSKIPVAKVPSERKER